MVQSKYIRKTTTVSCDESTRKFIAAEAERLGIPQREVLSRLVESYRHSHKRSATSAAEPQGNLEPSSINQTALEDRLSKVITKDVNRVIGFIQQQEKSYLTTILKNSNDSKAAIEKLIQSLDNFDNPDIDF